MKIGILTYHRAENYGGCLQAYALKYYLERKGHKVSFVDYWPIYHAKHYYYFNPYELKKRNWKGKIVYILYTMLSLPWLIKRKNNFKKFIKEHLRISGSPAFQNEHEICNEEYDAVVYGSDQIWRKQNFPDFRGYDSWYFGSWNISCIKKIAYAASIGRLECDEITIRFFREHLTEFSFLSVREQEAQKWLEKLGYNPLLVVDPVLLLKKEIWLELYSSSKRSTGKYILFYNLLGTLESISLAKKVAQEYQCEIRELTKNRDLHGDNKRYIKSASISDFISLIANAEAVVGNSFHGVAFSIIFEKEFYAVGMGSYSERVVSLLSVLGIPERYVEQNAYPQNKIDYSLIRKKMELLAGCSQKYLDISLESL